MTQASRRLYFVTTLLLDETKSGSDFEKRERTPGFFETREEALQCVTENWGDIFEEEYYNYAVVESFEPGLYPYEGYEALWFKATRVKNGDKYDVVQVEAPEPFKRVVGFAVG